MPRVKLLHKRQIEMTTYRITVYIYSYATCLFSQEHKYVFFPSSLVQSSHCNILMLTLRLGARYNEWHTDYEEMKIENHTQAAASLVCVCVCVCLFVWWIGLERCYFTQIAPSQNVCVCRTTFSAVRANTNKSLSDRLFEQSFWLPDLKPHKWNIYTEIKRTHM